MAFSANNAISQKVIGEQTVHFEFTQDRIPCLTETVSGDVIEIMSITNNTYHVRPRGVLYGEMSGEEYDIIYEYNSCGLNYGINPIFSSGRASHFVFPMLLKHDGKLIAEMVAVLHIVYDEKEW